MESDNDNLIWFIHIKNFLSKSPFYTNDDSFIDDSLNDDEINDKINDDEIIKINDNQKIENENDNDDNGYEFIIEPEINDNGKRPIKISISNDKIFGKKIESFFQQFGYNNFMSMMMNNENELKNIKFINNNNNNNETTTKKIIRYDREQLLDIQKNVLNNLINNNGDYLKNFMNLPVIQDVINARLNLFRLKY